jgi:hypothetical protein
LGSGAVLPRANADRPFIVAAVWLAGCLRLTYLKPSSLPGFWLRIVSIPWADAHRLTTFVGAAIWPRCDGTMERGRGGFEQKSAHCVKFLFADILVFLAAFCSRSVPETVG